MWPKVTNQMHFRSDKTHKVTRCKQAQTVVPLPPSKSTDMIVNGQKTESMFHALSLNYFLANIDICRDLSIQRFVFLTEITGVVNCALKKYLYLLTSDMHMQLA